MFGPGEEGGMAGQGDADTTGDGLAIAGDGRVKLRHEVWMVEAKFLWLLQVVAGRAHPEGIGMEDDLSAGEGSAVIVE